MQHPPDQARLLEADLDRALAGLRLRGRDAGPQHDLSGRRLHRHPVDRPQELGNRVRGHLGRPGRERLTGGERPAERIEVHGLATVRVEPSFDV